MNGTVVGLGLVIVTVMSTAGFLYHNFKPGYIFMGDTGSTLLGFLLAMFALENTDATHSMIVWAVPCLALGIPILDTLLSMGRRILARRSPFSPDQDHIHHRMRRVLGSQGRAVGVLYLVGLGLGLVSIAVVVVPPPWGQILIGLTVVALFFLITWIGYTRTIWRILLVRYYRKVRRKPKKRVKEALEPAVEVANAEVLEEVYS
jgi:UDP-GlcNAc:undecaprenyl-phosphate GlcNAc-1-phosphate transferase